MTVRPWERFMRDDYDANKERQHSIPDVIHFPPYYELASCVERADLSTKIAFPELFHVQQTLSTFSPKSPNRKSPKTQLNCSRLTVLKKGITILSKNHRSGFLIP